LGGLAAILAALALPLKMALAMTVQPVIVDLKTTGRGVSATVAVQNTFAAPLPVGITVQSLDFDEKGAKPTGNDPGDLLVYPIQALIPPGQTQTFRVQWAGDPQLAQSKHYYVTVAQLPVKLPEGQSAIQILYNFQVLVNVAAPAAKAQLSVISAAPVMADIRPAPGQPAAKGPLPKEPQPEVVVRNSGANYAYLSRATVEITEEDASGKQIFDKTLSPNEMQQTLGFGLVGPNAQRRVVIPVTLPGEHGTVKVRILSMGDQP
jgi:fimbrial chaperone protein